MPMTRMPVTRMPTGMGMRAMGIRVQEWLAAVGIRVTGITAMSHGP